MVFLCWTNSGDLKFVKAMKFVELVAGNMLAVTNVAICVNLALVVSVSDAKVPKAREGVRCTLP